MGPQHHAHENKSDNIKPKKTKKPDTHKCYRVHDISAARDMSVVLEEHRPIDPNHRPVYRLDMVRQVENKDRKETVLLKDVPLEARQTYAERFDPAAVRDEVSTPVGDDEVVVEEVDVVQMRVIRTGKAQYDAVGCSLVDPARLYDIWTSVMAEEQRDLELWTKRKQHRPHHGGRIHHQMQIPAGLRDKLPQQPVEPRHRDREKNRAEREAAAAADTRPDEAVTDMATAFEQYREVQLADAMTRASEAVQLSPTAQLLLNRLR